MAESTPEQPFNNPIKDFLGGINAYFRMKNQQPVFAPPQVRLKIERGNGFAKNLMRLCNKTMIGLNRIHISRGKFFAGFVGMAFGYLCCQGEQAYLEFQRSYRPTIKTALIQHVLRSQDVKSALNATLLQNVYKNPQIQYSLHQVLDWKAIRPQMNSLLQLSKQAIMKALRDPTTIHSLSNVTAEAITSNRELITRATLDFLQSDQLRGIAMREIASFFRSELFYDLLARQIVGNVSSGLANVQNRDGLYLFCRENFLNW